MQYRSSTRLGQFDWDVERLRYNQFVRMLEANGGWEVAPLPRLNYAARAPYRWTELLLQKSAAAVERLGDQVLLLASDPAKQSADGSGSGRGAARRVLEQARLELERALQPLEQELENRAQSVLEPLEVGVGPILIVTI